MTNSCSKTSFNMASTSLCFMLLSISIRHVSSFANFHCYSGQHAHKTGLIYMDQDSGFFNISCILVGKDGTNSSGSSGAGWTAITGLGHQLLLKIRNHTWYREFAFPPPNLGVWHLSVSMAIFSMNGDKGKGTLDLMTEWFYTVEMDIGLYRGYGSILLLDRQPLFHWYLGNTITTQEVLKHSIRKLVAHHSPCSENIWILAPVIDGEVLIGTSFSALNKEDFRWQTLTEQIMLACVNHKTSCSKQDLVLTEIVFTNYHILLVTSLGYFVSSRLHNIKSSADSQSRQVSWHKVNPFNGTKFAEIETHRQSTVHSTTICLDKQRKCILQETVEVSYTHDTLGAMVCVGATDLIVSNAWSCSQPPPTDETYSVLQTVILEWSEVSQRAAVKITLPSFDKLRFPPFTFPKMVRFHKLVIHPRSITIFLLGEELWASYDLGATFVVIYQPPTASRITRLIFNGDSIHSEILAISQSSDGSETLAYGTLGSKRLHDVMRYTAPTVAHIVVNNRKKLEMLQLLNGEFVRKIMVEDVKEAIIARKHLNISLAVQFTSEEEIVAKHMVESRSLVIRPYHLGLMLVHRSGGRARITDIHQPREDHSSAQITLSVVKHFFNMGGLTRQNQLLIQKVNLTLAMVTQVDSDLNPVPNAWTKDDIGKTAVIAFQSNLLITTYHNSSTIMAIPVETDVKNTLVVVEGMWKLLDLSASSWWLEEDDCRQILQVTPEVPQTVLTLDLGTSVLFNIVAAQAFTKTSHQNRLTISYSNPFLFRKDNKVTEQPGSTIMKLRLTDRYFKKAASSMIIYYPYSSMQCEDTSAIYTILLCCPSHKRLVFNYPYPITPERLLAEGSVDHFLVQLPVNYRPPSRLGIAIPLTSNLYNADPHQPLFKSRYQISQQTAKFKFPAECYLNLTEEQPVCGCDSARRVSRLVENSDCITKVYGLRLPGLLYLCFGFETMNTTSSQIFLTEIPDLYTVTVDELNNRTDYVVETVGAESSLTQVDSVIMAEKGVKYSTNPYNLRIKMINSGLYHFRSTIPSHMSYCNLQTEFVVYVRKPPVPYPVLFLVNFGVSIGMGFVMYLVYAVCRLNTSYRMNIIMTHKGPTCKHKLIPQKATMSTLPGARMDETEQDQVNKSGGERKKGVRKRHKLDTPESSLRPSNIP